MHHKLAVAGLSAVVLMSACSSNVHPPKQNKPNESNAQPTKAVSPKQGASRKPAPISKTPSTEPPESVKKETIQLISTTSGRPMNVFVVTVKTPSEKMVRWANQNGAILETSCNQPLPITIQKLRCQKGSIKANRLKSLNQLTYFDAGETPVDVRWLSILGSKASLSHLNLSSTRLKDAHLKSLKALTTLKTLNLSSNGQLTGKGLIWLKGNTNLNVLNLEHIDLQPKFGASVAGFPRLVYLNVNHVGLNDKGIEAWDKLVNLKVLEVRFPKWSAKALDTLHKLKALEVIKTEFDDALLGMPSHPIVNTLINVHKSPLTDKDLALIGKMSNLKSLSLKHSKVTDDGMKHLANLTQLRHLVLERMTITDKGMQYIKGLKNLEYLSVYKSKSITGKALEYIEPLKKLNTLYLGGTQIKDADLARLASWKHVTDLGLCNADHITEKALKKHDFKHLSRRIRLVCKDSDHNCDHD